MLEILYLRTNKWGRTRLKTIHLQNRYIYKQDLEFKKVINGSYAIKQK